jgi:hypothetical protein
VVFQGCISTRRTPINPLAKCLITAIPAWKNLVAMTMNPMQAPEDLFAEPFRMLRNSSDLRILKVNAAYTVGTSVSTLSEIAGLESLTVIDPGRKILDLLPGWLSRLSGTLRKLHLLVSASLFGAHTTWVTRLPKDNCGSITPGVLQTIQPLAVRLQSFALGLSYSLEDGHILEFLSRLPRLQDLQLRYYWVSGTRFRKSTLLSVHLYRSLFSFSK